MEFAWNEGNEPTEFPAEDTIISITGIFEKYYNEVWEWDYYRLTVDSINIL
jgi:hypothetical protein